MNIPRTIRVPMEDSESTRAAEEFRAIFDSNTRRRRSDRVVDDSEGENQAFPTNEITNPLFEPELHGSAFDNAASEIPEDGGIYLIREIHTKRMLTLARGKLTIEYGTLSQGGRQWACEDLSSGHMAFREIVSGRYLGRRHQRRRFRVEEKKPGRSEAFVLRPRKQGGFNLMVKQRGSLKALTIVDDDDEGGLKLRKATDYNDAARWEFIKVS